MLSVGSRICFYFGLLHSVDAALQAQRKFNYHSLFSGTMAMHLGVARQAARQAAHAAYTD